MYFVLYPYILYHRAFLTELHQKLYRVLRRDQTINQIGIVVSSLYLLFTLCHKAQIENHFQSSFKEQNINYSSLLTMPVGIANVNWYGVAKGKDSIYMLKHQVFSNTDNPIEVFPIHEEYLNQIDRNLGY